MTADRAYAAAKGIVWDAVRIEPTTTTDPSPAQRDIAAAALRDCAEVLDGHHTAEWLYDRLDTYDRHYTAAAGLDHYHPDDTQGGFGR